MTKNADFGPNLAVFGPKSLIFMGVSKSFGTNITENHLDNLSALFFGQALDKMGQIWPFLGPKSNFLGAGSKNFGTLVSGFQWDTFFVLKTLIIEAPIGRWGRKCAFLTPKFGYLGPKVNFLFSDRDFCWWNKWPLYPGLQLSNQNHPQKIFRFRARGHFLGLTPVFGRFWPLTR